MKRRYESRREALATGGQPAHRVVVQAQVEDRVHHARHRDRRTRANRHQQWIGGVAEASPVRCSSAARWPATCWSRSGGRCSRSAQVGEARLRRDREPIRNRQTPIEVISARFAPFPAQQRAHFGRTLGEVVDVGRHGGQPGVHERTPSSAARRRSSTSSAQRAAASSIASLVTSMTGSPGACAVARSARAPRRSRSGRRSSRVARIQRRAPAADLGQPVGVDRQPDDLRRLDLEQHRRRVDARTMGMFAAM